MLYEVITEEKLIAIKDEALGIGAVRYTSLVPVFRTIQLDTWLLLVDFWLLLYQLLNYLFGDLAGIHDNV